MIEEGLPVAPLPFLPVRLMQGSGLMKYWGISEEQRKTLDKVDDLIADLQRALKAAEKFAAAPTAKAGA